MAYRLSFTATLLYNGKPTTCGWACDYPEDIATVLAAMKGIQDQHNKNVQFGALKGHPPFVDFTPIQKVSNRFVD
jgi:hypothetical protein